MYSKEDLSRIPFFKDILKKQQLNNVIDSLTGLVSRPYIIRYVHYLVDSGTPFTFAILDLDNFKFINDTYGHKAGDGVLESVARDLQHHLQDFGVAGRFGGDEFLIINLRDLEYDDIKAYYQSIYENYTVLRKNANLEMCKPFITGTIGSATYPKDAQDYDTLFSLIDKTLYRGKTKGRNCYIIYVKEKHEHIVIQDLKGHGLYTTFHDLAMHFDSTPDIYTKMTRMFETLREDMRISDLFYVGQRRMIRSITGNEDICSVSDLDLLMTEDLYSTNRPELIANIAPEFYHFIEKLQIETLLIVRIGSNIHTDGFLLCAEPRNQRIWQEDEYAILFLTARLLHGYIQGNHIDF